MVIEVVRIGQRVVRDDRVTTHVALVARAFGANTIFMTEVNREIKNTLKTITVNIGVDWDKETSRDFNSLIVNKDKK